MVLQTPRPPLPRLPLLGRFHQQWPSDPYPMVVETSEDDDLCICAAPSLWMGARWIAGGLEGQGFQPGQTVSTTRSSGAVWLQALVATLRVGGGFDASRVWPDWLVDPERVIHPGQSSSLPAPRGIRLHRRGTWAWHAAEKWPLDPRRYRRGDCVTCSEDWSDEAVFFDKLLPALVAGAELHCAAGLAHIH